MGKLDRKKKEVDKQEVNKQEEEVAVVSTYGIDYEPAKGWERNASSFANDVLSEGAYTGEILSHRHNKENKTCTLHCMVYALNEKGEMVGEGIKVMFCATWIPKAGDGKRPEVFDFDWTGKEVSDVREAA